ncbi:N-terminal half of MaoC dehydratase [Parafrankia irregularis]|uniref:N-terminal half of MaoC dehydratase n=1 Tax=Parafrankia irregularis TaxID=795642 RepID=A0A0S4QW59_9ACTN|nr:MULTISPECIES: MaoC family dehydratase N-terminal domain-containing protein [Parafrankia]MBE3199946.1 MaoC family dehydratase N-terminal domain-containing protein [Parafrankia sp. CH37]CUU59310.1 N-terminal half of MaoC dehydratase [Parafrankia irregularis]
MSEGYPMTLETGKIREFARATGSSAPEYLREPAPTIPVTFLRTSIFWMPPDGPSLFGDLQLDLRRILHGEQEFVFFGPPPRAGTELTVTSRLGGVTEKEGGRGGRMRFVEIVNDFLDESGRLVARSNQTLIETGKAPS